MSEDYYGPVHYSHRLWSWALWPGNVSEDIVELNKMTENPLEACLAVF